jgi:hypothetical protein
VLKVLSDNDPPRSLLPIPIWALYFAPCSITPPPRSSLLSPPPVFPEDACAVVELVALVGLHCSLSCVHGLLAGMRSSDCPALAGACWAVAASRICFVDAVSSPAWG